MKATFEEIAQEFDRRTRRIVWCSASTINPQNRTRVRVLHPIWEGSTGWIFTRRHSPKEAHLAHNPHMSLCYLELLEPFGTEQVYVDCTARWEDDQDSRERVWELCKSMPPPMGYDPGLMWKGPDDPEYGLLKLTPWRIELASLKPTAGGWTTQVWKPGS